MNRKILITGGSGLLGQYLNIECSTSNTILTCYNKHIGNCNNFDNVKIDITDFDSVREVFHSFQPEIVIHTAAITNTIPLPDQNPKDVYRVNVHATKNIAELCEKMKSKLIYISTDLVYAGYRGSMLEENAKLIPVSLYAETKLMSEQKIRGTFNNYLILRTALLYGLGLTHSKCHFDNMNNELKQGREVTLFSDQFRTPISLKEAVRIILQLAELDINNETINVGGIERVSRYELGEILCSVAGYDKSLLKKNSLNDIPQLPKVEDVSLNTDKLQSLGINPKTIEESILEIIREN
jgi:dTDP-4-dehydrorhamnose reductase